MVSTVNIPAGEPMSPNPITPRAMLQQRNATFNGHVRTWYEYVPATYKGDRAVPLVVAVHGGSADGAWMFRATAWAQLADQLGFIVVYPNGSMAPKESCAGTATRSSTRMPRWRFQAITESTKRSFFKGLIEKTEATYKIDSTRVYMHSQSNGGMMTSYFGLRYPEMLAAMAVGSTPPSIKVMSKYPQTIHLPTYFWSGENDTVAGQYNPSNKARVVICRDFAEFWAKLDQVHMEPRLQLDGLYNTLIYEGDAEVRSTEFRNGVHTLPFTAAYLVWNNFFSRFARENGKIVRLIPDAEQAAPADEDTVVLKLGSPLRSPPERSFALGRLRARSRRSFRAARVAG
jgi:poly(3-hydroxybutyrate) depolymerase